MKPANSLKMKNLKLVELLVFFILASDISAPRLLAYGASQELNSNDTNQLAETGSATSSQAPRDSSTSSPPTSTLSSSSSSSSLGSTSGSAGLESGSTANLHPDHDGYLVTREPSDSLLSQEQLVQASNIHYLSRNHNHYNSHNNHFRHNNHHHNHLSSANHQATGSYSPEPYTSASYTSLVATGHPNATQLNNLLNREHHQSLGHNPRDSYNSNGAESSSSFSNHRAPTASTSAGSGDRTAQATGRVSLPEQSNYSGNHSGNQQQQSNILMNNVGSLNTGLIQNLTASLFPIKQLSNATLLSLSELLNRTRNSHTALVSVPSDSREPIYSPTRGYYQAGSLPATSALAQQMAAAVNQQTEFPNSIGQEPTGGFNFFDYLKPPSGASSQLWTEGGTRGYHSAPLPFFGPSGGSHQPKAGSGGFGGYQAPGGSSPRSPSNIFTSFVPFSGGPSMQREPQPSSLNAAALYESLLDSGAYRPLIVGNLKSYLELAAGGSHKPTYLPTGAQSSAGYQFVQQHSANNHNQLDKIVYHSTPFRPSIVSPPSSSSSEPGKTGGGGGSSGPDGSSGTSSTTTASSIPAAGSIRSMVSGSNSRQHKQHGDSSSDHLIKSVASSFASMSSPTSTDSRSEYVPIITMQGVLNNSTGHRFVKDHPSSFLRKPEASSGHQTTSPTINMNDDFDQLFDAHLNSLSSGQLDKATSGDHESSSSSKQNRTVPATGTGSSGSGGGGSTSGGGQAQPNSNQAPGSATVVAGTSAALFDLYEREIDNQIREALYGSSDQLLRSPHHQTAATSGHPSSAHWFEKSPSASSLFDSGDLSIGTNPMGQALGSWARPLPLGGHLGGSSGSYHLPSASGPRGTAAAAAVPTTDLAAALQDLPTFAASDLQPIFPTQGPAYSLLPGQSPPSIQDTAFSDTPSITSLASHLIQQQSALEAGPEQPSASYTGSGMRNKYNKYTNSHHHGSHFQPQTSGSASSVAHSSSSGGLPAILSKLANPLGHLLPKNRGKKPNQSSGANYPNQQHHSFSNQHNHFHSSPSTTSSSSSLFPLSGRNLLAALGVGSSGESAGSHKNKHQQSNRYQQQQQQANLNHLYQQHRMHQINQLANYQRQQQVAMAAANLLAVAAQPQMQFNPLQLALLQAQASNTLGAYLPPESEPLQAPPTSASSSALLDADQSGQTETSGARGAGQIWRNLLSPAHWARKQSIAGGSSTSSSSSSSLSAPSAAASGQSPLYLAATSLLPSSSSLVSALTHYGSHHHKSNNNDNHNHGSSSNHNNRNNNHGYGNKQQQGSSISGSGSLFGSSLAAHLFSLGHPMATSASTNSIRLAPPQQTQLGGESSGSSSDSGASLSQQKKPRIEIKILKIPVAFYEPLASGSTTTTTTTASGGHSASQSSSPDHRLAASLLAQIPCPLSHGDGHQYPHATAQFPPHSLEHHLLNMHPQAAASVALSSVLPPPPNTTVASSSPALRSVSPLHSIDSVSAASSSSTSAPMSTTEATIMIQRQLSASNRNFSNNQPNAINPIHMSASSIQSKLLKLAQ